MKLAPLIGAVLVLCTALAAAVDAGREKKPKNCRGQELCSGSIDENVEILNEDNEAIGRQYYQNYKGVQTKKVGSRKYKCTLNINYSLLPPKCIKATAKCKPVPKKPITFIIDTVDAVLTVSVAKNKVTGCKVENIPTTILPTVARTSAAPPIETTTPGTTENIPTTIRPTVARTSAAPPIVTTTPETPDWGCEATQKKFNALQDSVQIMIEMMTIMQSKIDNHVAAGGVCGEICYTSDTCSPTCSECFRENGNEVGYCRRPVTANASKYPQIVESGEILGEHCNRDCITNNENNTCAFTFYIENLQSDENGRRADGRIRNVTTYNGVLPGPGIVVCEGDSVVVRLFNRIEGTFEQLNGHSSGTTFHMHGIRRYNESFEDGVPGVNQCEVKSGDSFNYTMKAKIENHENAPNGTYWYHSHVGSQRTDGAEGKLIIMPRTESNLYDIDNADNTLFLQEWYIAPNNNTPISILVNGKGRVGPTMNSVPEDKNWDEQIHKYNLGYQVEFEQVPNPDYNSGHFLTNYAEFDVEKDLRYRFRIIGAIGQNFPLLVSIEDHNFTAIATDAVEFNPVENIQGVWLSAGERYDIVIHTMKNPRDDPYKIKVYGNTANNSALCTVAWLKYPGQEIDKSYIPDSKCIGFNAEGLQKILNPVRSTYVDPNNTKYVLLNDLRSKNHQLNNMNQTFDTYYVDFINLSFNNLSMTYDDIPFLYQSPAKPTCGPNCNITYDGPDSTVTCDNTIRIPDHCTEGDRCQCPHVNHQPHVPGPKGPVRWFETILINPSDSDMPVSHPIHQHGGWFVLMNEYQFPFNTIISRDLIIEMDTNCTLGKLCLPRNRYYPIQKDTIQVPQNGYVIVRTRVDNAGTWIFHCHINHHVESGMAMVLQIGGLGDELPSSQHWNLGPYKDQINEKCPRKLNTYQNPASIKWFYGMKPVTACVKPGNNLTFVWNYGHNVNNVTKETWEECRPGGPKITFEDKKPYYGDYTVHLPEKNTTLYFACGLYEGYHCQYGGLKAKVVVSEDCYGGQ